MGFACRGVWVMGYYGPMGFSIEIPAHQVGGPENLWGIRGYGLPGVWDMRVSTVSLNNFMSGAATSPITNSETG